MATSRRMSEAELKNKLMSNHQLESGERILVAHVLAFVAAGVLGSKEGLVLRSWGREGVY